MIDQICIIATGMMAAIKIGYEKGTDIIGKIPITYINIKKNPIILDLFSCGV